MDEGSEEMSDRPDIPASMEPGPSNCPRSEPVAATAGSPASVGPASAFPHPEHPGEPTPWQVPYAHAASQQTAQQVSPPRAPAPTHLPPPAHGYWGSPQHATTVPQAGHGQWGPPAWPPASGGVPWQVPGPPARRQRGKGLLVMALVWSVIVAAGLGALVGHQVWSSASPNSVQSTGSSYPSVKGGGTGGKTVKVPAGSTAAEIANDIDPALVDIDTTLSYESLQGAGTGMVLTSNGLILTNNHVVEGATSISVIDIGNGKTYSASVVGYDRSDDVALIQLANASGLTTVTLGSNVTNNEKVIAIGNAGGKGGTPSYVSGTVTGLDQSITASDEATGASEQLTGLIETDADIVPGDSGGPLVNSSGQVVGMDTAASQGYQFQNTGSQGYAIPITKAQTVASEIQAGPSSSSIHVGPTAFLGVDVSENEASGYGTSGAVIAEVLPNTPAASAGLEEGDTITSLGGTSVTSPQGLTNVMLAQKPGVTVQVQYTDPEGNQQSVSIELQSGPPQ
jgi:S1-C subfamily serine protease